MDEHYPPILVDATADDILSVVRDMHRQQCTHDPEANPNISLSHDSTIAALIDIHEIVEIHTITGQGDLLCRIVARSNDHLHEVLQQIAKIETVMRSQTQLALSTPHQRGVLDALLALRG